MSQVARRRRLLLPEMEGPMARWYDKQRGTPGQMAVWRKQAAELTAGLPEGAAVPDVAPGPANRAVEMARTGRLGVTGLDTSRTMVEIARGHAEEAAVAVDFRHGDAGAMPFAAGSFDLIVCQAAFKNFRQPVRVLDQMHRVLRAGATAVIQDMSRDATDADIAREVAAQGLSALNATITRQILKGLRRRAWSPDRFRELVAGSAFGVCEILAEGIGLEVRLQKTAA